jgi:N-acetylglucosaminyl-diphospho-decaprenol L-rhamnosyltransferase
MRAATTIVIVSWNSAVVLPDCLGALDPAADIIVIDNASEDGSAELVARRFPHVRLLREARNLGFAAAINKAAASTAADYLLLLNPDVVATEGAVARLSGFLEDHEDCGAVAGLLVDETGVPQRGFAVRRFPTLATWAVDLLLIDEVWPSNPITQKYRAVDVDLRAPVDVDQPAAACLMLRRAAFDAIGGMDGRFYPAWFEDVDLCLRLRRAGWRILLVPDALFRHTGGVSMKMLGPAVFNRIWYRNLQRYVAKHHGAVGLAAVKALIVTGMLARAIAALLRRDAESVRAYGGVIRDTIAE